MLHDGDFATAANVGELGRIGAGADVDRSFAQHDAALDGGGWKAGEDDSEQCKTVRHVGTPKLVDFLDWE
ncbi:MAG: hypothetical protein ABSE85_17665 [Candidatus Korobacteraceae bacterium]